MLLWTRVQFIKRLRQVPEKHLLVHLLDGSAHRVSRRSDLFVTAIDVIIGIDFDADDLAIDPIRIHPEDVVDVELVDPETPPPGRRPILPPW